MQGGPLLCVTLDFSPTLPPPGLFPHLRGQRWLRSRGAVRGNENHVERPCRGTSLALGTPRTVPRKEGVTQSQGPLPPHALSFSSWRQRWQHQRLGTLLQSVGTARARPRAAQCLPVSCWCPDSTSPAGAEPWPCGSRRSSSREKPCGRCRRSMGSTSPSRCGTICRSGLRARHGRSGVPFLGMLGLAALPQGTGGCSSPPGCPDTALLCTQGLHRPRQPPGECEGDTASGGTDPGAAEEGRPPSG